MREALKEYLSGGREDHKGKRHPNADKLTCPEEAIDLAITLSTDHSNHCDKEQNDGSNGNMPLVCSIREEGIGN